MKTIGCTSLNPTAVGAGGVLKGSGDSIVLYEKSLIEQIHSSVSTYKSKETLHFLYKIASGFNVRSRVLILGPGQGSEVIVIKKACPSCFVTAIDMWENDVDGWREKGMFNFFQKNLESNFLNNCSRFNVEIDNAIKKDIFTTDVLRKIGEDWDFIYYDCKDNTDGKEYRLIFSMLKFLWTILNKDGILAGDDYKFDKPDFKMTPIVDDFVYSLKEPNHFYFDNKNLTSHWMVKKNG